MPYPNIDSILHSATFCDLGNLRSSPKNFFAFGWLGFGPVKDVSSDEGVKGRMGNRIKHLMHVDACSFNSNSVELTFPELYNLSHRSRLFSILKSILTTSLAVLTLSAV